MKKNKKLNSIATMSKEELQEVNGGMMGYPDMFPRGVPAIDYLVSSTDASNLVIHETINLRTIG